MRFWVFRLDRYIQGIAQAKCTALDVECMYCKYASAWAFNFQQPGRESPGVSYNRLLPLNFYGRRNARPAILESLMLALK
jgi:uncharacterized Fe-S cluster-containing radical SAM superfamily protein